MRQADVGTFPCKRYGGGTTEPGVGIRDERGDTLQASAPTIRMFAVIDHSDQAAMAVPRLAHYLGSLTRNLDRPRTFALACQAASGPRCRAGGSGE